MDSDRHVINRILNLIYSGRWSPMTWRALSISNNAGQFSIRSHVIKRNLNPRLLSEMAFYDVASTIHQSLPRAQQRLHHCLVAVQRGVVQRRPPVQQWYKLKLKAKFESAGTKQGQPGVNSRPTRGQLKANSGSTQANPGSTSTALP